MILMTLLCGLHTDMNYVSKQFSHLRLDTKIFVQHLNICGYKVSSIKEIKSGVTFIVCTFQSAYSMLSTQNLHVDKLQQEIRSRMSLLFIDEAHMSMADTFEATIGFLHNRTKKLSECYTRRDGVNRELIETRRLAHFFNDNIIDIESEWN